MTPFELHENSADPLSTDSVVFKVTEAIKSLGFATAGQDSFASLFNLCKPVLLWMQQPLKCVVEHL